MNRAQEEKKISKFLSLVLRHKPQHIGLKLDQNGWAGVSELLLKAKQHGMHISIQQLETVVHNNDKQRFLLDAPNNRIRANQGHSINVDLELKPHLPPKYLYHGTVAAFIDDIYTQGLQKMKRQHVHLSKDKTTANKVGMRRGKPIILTIDAEKMAKDGHQFFLSENEVWLTDKVLPKYILRD